MTRTRTKILVLVTHYLPGYKAGGPIRTISNLVDHLGDEFDFRILTSDRDATDIKPYPSIEVGTWQSVGKAQVCYLPPQIFKNPFLICKYIRGTDHNLVYLNSYFATQTVIYLLLRFFRLIHQTPLIVAPRGEFSTGAIAIKSLKKQIYITLAKFLRLYDSVLWQASSIYEQNDIKAVYPGAEVHIALNLLPHHYASSQESRYKEVGSAKIVFLSRITPKKNLHMALEILSLVKAQVTLDIFGTIRDQEYWKLCKDLIEKMPENVTVTYKDEITHDQVISTLSQYHLFFLPTLGENFGHAIIEAFNAGCLVLISDQTPWRDLENQGVGWDVALERTDEFANIIHEIADMDNAVFQESSQRARVFGQSLLRSKNDIEANQNLFYLALNKGVNR